jgi:hypothetical protein
LNDKLSGFLEVAIAISPWSMTSWTRWLPNPVEVPVMKKTRDMMADVETSLLIPPVKPVNLNMTYLSEDLRRGADTYSLSAPGFSNVRYPIMDSFKLYISIIVGKLFHA